MSNTVILAIKAYMREVEGWYLEGKSIINPNVLNYSKLFRYFESSSGTVSDWSHTFLNQ